MGVLRPSVLEMSFAEGPIMGIQETNLSTNKQLCIMSFYNRKFILWSLTYPQELPVHILAVILTKPCRTDVSPTL